MCMMMFLVSEYSVELAVPWCVGFFEKGLYFVITMRGKIIHTRQTAQ